MDIFEYNRTQVFKREGLIYKIEKQPFASKFQVMGMDWDLRKNPIFESPLNMNLLRSKEFVGKIDKENKKLEAILKRVLEVSNLEQGSTWLARKVLRIFTTDSVSERDVWPYLSIVIAVGAICAIVLLRR